jgi:hypothetical protein
LRLRSDSNCFTDSKYSMSAHLAERKIFRPKMTANRQQAHWAERTTGTIDSNNVGTSINSNTAFLKKLYLFPIPRFALLNVFIPAGVSKYCADNAHFFLHSSNLSYVSLRVTDSWRTFWSYAFSTMLIIQIRI